MENIDNDTEKFIDESMPFIFDRLGDTTALTKHGCLTVAQCALLMPAMLTENRPDDSSEIAAHYMQLALLDIAEGELSPKHPETLIPYSQYLRMMESGMYGVKGESLPLPTLDWLVSLDEATQWLKSKGIDINLDGLMAELGDGNTAPEQEAATPGVVEPDKAGPLPLTTSDIAHCFAGLKWETEQAWKKPLGDIPKWLKPCIAIPGVRGASETRWNPVSIGAALVRSGEKLNSVRGRFQSSRFTHLLGPWLEEWKTYEADNFDT
jgi:hypothetical protein